MKPSFLLKLSLLGALIVVGSLLQVQAQIEVRLSIKVILDANGMRPAGGVLSTDDGIRNGVANANTSMASFGRVYQRCSVKMKEMFLNERRDGLALTHDYGELT